MAMFGKKLTPECQELILNYTGGITPPGVSAEDWKRILRQWAAEAKKYKMPEAKSPQLATRAATRHDEEYTRTGVV